MKLLLAQSASSVERRGLLTGRQQQVMTLVCQGLSNKAIARELRLSEGTVKLHVHNILVKVGARSRREIIVAAARGRLID
jgi:two-component system, NarL family, nitrate/nitrite response regulator NarL